MFVFFHLRCFSSREGSTQEEDGARGAGRVETEPVLTAVHLQTSPGSDVPRHPAAAAGPLVKPEPVHRQHPVNLTDLQCLIIVPNCG